MADPTPQTLPSTSLMSGLALVAVVFAGVAGLVAFAPSKEQRVDRQPATPAEATASAAPIEETNAGVTDATPTVSQQSDDEPETVEATNRSEAQAQSKKRRCFQNLFPVTIVQKLNDDAFLAYSRFSVGSQMPVVLTYIGDKRPSSSGYAMLSPRDGLLVSGRETIEMESGFSRKADLLTVGDKRCARLWAVIERGLEADRIASQSAPVTAPRSTVPRGREDPRRADSPPSEDPDEEVVGIGDVVR